MRIAVGILIAALSSCSSATRAPALSPTNSTTRPLAFDWFPPCRVPLTTEMDTDGGPSTVRSMLLVEPGLRSEELTVRVTDMETGAPWGDRASGPEDLTIDDFVGGFSLVVSTEGRYLRSEGVEQIYEEFARTLAPDAPLADEMLRLMRASREVRQVMDLTFAAVWFDWVELWLELDVQPGRTQRARRRYPLNGYLTDLDVSFEHLPAAPSRPEVSRLVARFDDDGATTTRKDRLMLSEISKLVGQEPPPMDFIVERFRVTVSIDVHRKNRRPMSVVIEKAPIEGDSLGPATITRFVFDWASAEGCGARPGGR